MHQPEILRTQQFPSLRPVSLGILVLAALGLAPLGAGAATAPATGKEQCKPVSARGTYIVSELDSLSASAEEIYAQAQAGKLDRAAKKLEALKKNAAVFDYLQDEATLILLPRLGRTIAELEKNLAAKNRLETMRYANRITLIAATVAVPFKPCVPTEVALLDYNGRELEIWSEVKKTDKLSGIVIRMHLAWQTLMPKLIEQNGTKELRRFSEVMGHLELAKLPEEYGRLARQVLVEADAIKGVFLKPAK